MGAPPVGPARPARPAPVLAAHFAKVVWLLSLNALLCQRPEFLGVFLGPLGGTLTFTTRLTRISVFTAQFGIGIVLGISQICLWLQAAILPCINNKKYRKT